MNIASDEFFVEMRMQGAEHLGQVHLGIRERTVTSAPSSMMQRSVLPGLSALPPEQRPTYHSAPASGLYAITSQIIEEHPDATCPRYENTHNRPSHRKVRVCADARREPRPVESVIYRDRRRGGCRAASIRKTRSTNMIGDYSSINDHLETARKLADTAETKADPAIYREAIDELVAAIRLLMRNSQVSED